MKPKRATIKCPICEKKNNIKNVHEVFTCSRCLRTWKFDWGKSYAWILVDREVKKNE